MIAHHFDGIFMEVAYSRFPLIYSYISLRLIPSKIQSETFSEHTTPFYATNGDLTDNAILSIAQTKHLYNDLAFNTIFISLSEASH